MRYRLFYDATCPVCTNYVRLLQRKIDAKEVEFIPTESKSKEFQFVTPDNRVYAGEKAIEQLASHFPAVLSYFWMLPNKYKVKGLKTAYKAGSAARKIIKRKKGGCGCGKKKRR